MGVSDSDIRGVCASRLEAIERKAAKQKAEIERLANVDPQDKLAALARIRELAGSKDALAFIRAC